MVLKDDGNAPAYSGWIGFDLDGVLAEWGTEPGMNHTVHRVGKPIQAMIQKLKDHVFAGDEVRIFTARVCVTGETSPEGCADEEFAAYQRGLIDQWMMQHVGFLLPITNVKDFRMWKLYDDRCEQVISNTGVTVNERIAELEGMIRHAVEAALKETEERETEGTP